MWIVLWDPILKFFFFPNKLLTGPINSTRDPLKTQNIAKNLVSTLSKFVRLVEIAKYHAYK